MPVIKPVPMALIAALAIGLSFSAHAFEERTMETIHITMEGTPGAVFSAQWRITQNGQVIEHIEERGTVPTEYTFTGSAIEGTVKLLSDNQRLEVEILKGSNRSRSSTQSTGGTLTVGVR